MIDVGNLFLRRNKSTGNFAVNISYVTGGKYEKKSEVKV